MLEPLLSSLDALFQNFILFFSLAEDGFHLLAEKGCRVGIYLFIYFFEILQPEDVLFTHKGLKSSTGYTFLGQKYFFFINVEAHFGTL